MTTVVPAPPGYNSTPQYPLPTQAPRSYFGEHPVPATCPFCHATVVTGTELKTGLIAWAAAGIICIVFPPFTWFGCCLIPFCISSLKDVEHTCPRCTRIIYKYDRM